MNSIEERITCRVCDGKLKAVLDLGEIYPSNFVKSNEGLSKAPLVLAQCESCGLVQLKHTVELDSMYRQYWYRSGLNPSMRRDLQDVVDSVEALIDIQNNDVIVDIGCNDGTQLGMYKNKNAYKIGVDPALNLKTENCDLLINDYFTAKPFGDLIKPKVITSIAMFYDLEDPHTFVHDIKSILAEDRVWVVQFTDLISMLKLNAFDNICHEHLEYYALKDLVALFKQHNLSIFDVLYNQVNGGSLRVYVCHSGSRPINLNVLRALKSEQEYLDSFEDPIAYFADMVKTIKRTILHFIRQENINGNRIALLAASTKGNTLLQYFGLDSFLIDHAAEINKDKFGLKTVGTNIRIISEEDSMWPSAPEYYLVLAWHFIGDFIDRKKDYLLQGGKFIVPMPIPSVIMKGKENEIICQELR